MRKSLGTIVVNFLLGMILGGIVSQVLALFLQEGSILHSVLVRGVTWGPTMNTWDLVVVKITFGLELHLTLMSLVGLFVAAQIMRWYR